MAKKNKIKPAHHGLRVNVYNVLIMAVEDGVILGLNRAHKHSDKPSKEEITDKVISAVMSGIDEWFIFEDPYANQ